MKSNKAQRKTIIIGTRASLLAITQSKWVRNQFKKISPDSKIILKRIVTSGDRFRDQSLALIGGKGLFTKEIETNLLQGDIDLAVHSLKDLPVIIPQGLCLGAIPKRENPADSLIYNSRVMLNKDKNKPVLSLLPLHANIGTSSLRRQAQLLNFRNDFKIIPLRGNVPTRIRKIKENDLDAVIVAKAGINRLHVNIKNAVEISTKVMLPAIGQGALAIECRVNDNRILRLLKKLNHKRTAQCVTAERAFLGSLGGGCQFPIAALAEIKKGKLILKGLIISPDGHKQVRGSITGIPANAEMLGKKLGLRLLARGGRKILSLIKAYGNPGDKK